MIADGRLTGFTMAGRPALKHLAGWLVEECGLAQAETANLLNVLGHRTPHGRPGSDPRSQLWSMVAMTAGPRHERRGGPGPSPTRQTRRNDHRTALIGNADISARAVCTS